MPNSPNVIPGQLKIPAYTAELVPTGLPADVDPVSRIALTSLIDHLQSRLRFGPTPGFRDFRRAERREIETGLFLTPIEAQRAGLNLEHVARHGTGGYQRRDVPSLHLDKDKKGYLVAFQPAEFVVITRNARDLGRSTVTKTRRSQMREQLPDREANTEAAKRSGGHALKGKIASQSKLVEQLGADNALYKHLIEHLVNPGKTRVRAGRLDRERAQAVEKIHETAEVAAITLNFKNTAAAGLHKVIKRHIYQGNYSHAERTHFLIDYLQMVGLHNSAKIYKLGLAQAAAQQELAREYQPYLDKKEAEERASAQAA